MKLIIFIVVALLASFVASISITVLQPGRHVVADTAFHRFELFEGLFSIYFRDSTGTIRPGNRATFSAVNVTDQLWFTTTNGPGDRFLRFYGCNYTENFHVYSNYSVGYERSTNGTTFLVANSTTGAGCRWKFGYLVVDQPTFYDVGKANFTIQPWEVKLEVHVNCPWEAQIRAINTTIAPTQELFLRARQMRPVVTVNFNFTELIVPTQTVFKSGYQWDPSFTDHMRNSCYHAMPDGATVIPPYSLPGEFDFAAVGGVSVPTETVVASFFLLGWAFVDGQYYADVDGKIDQNSLAFTPYSITGFAVLRLMFANELFYDPTLEFLFVTQPPPPGSEVQPYLAAEVQTVNVAVAASLSVVAVIVVAVIIIGVVILRNRRAEDREKIRAAGKHQVGNDDYARSGSSSVNQNSAGARPAASSSQSEHQQRKWRPSTTTGVTLRNTDES